MKRLRRFLISTQSYYNLILKCSLTTCLPLSIYQTTASHSDRINFSFVFVLLFLDHSLFWKVWLFYLITTSSNHTWRSWLNRIAETLIRQTYSYSSTTFAKIRCSNKNTYRGICWLYNRKHIKSAIDGWQWILVPQLSAHSHRNAIAIICEIKFWVGIKLLITYQNGWERRKKHKHSSTDPLILWWYDRMCELRNGHCRFIVQIAYNLHFWCFQ